MLGNTALNKWCCLGYELQKLYRAFVLSCYFKYSLLSIRILAWHYLQKMILSIRAARMDISNELQWAASIANPELAGLLRSNYPLFPILHLESNLTSEYYKH